jgi:hypothetical protein
VILLSSGSLPRGGYSPIFTSAASTSSGTMRVKRFFKVSCLFATAWVLTPADFSAYDAG